MRELDLVEQRLKQQQAQATEGLKLIGAMRNLLTAADAAAKPKPKPKAKSVVATYMSAESKKRQRQASKIYWAKVKSGEIVRKGYKAKTNG